MFSKAMEAMDFQINTKLGEQLDAIWQDVIDYRDTKLKDLTPTDRRNKLHDYFRTKSVKKFFDVVWKYAGFWVDEMEFMQNFDTDFATCMFIGNWGATFIEYVKSAGTRGSFPNKLPVTADELISIVKAFDPKTGGIKTSVRNKLKELVHCQMFFDFEMAFCITDNFPAGTPVENFTAREISGIMLHEIGHTLSLLEYAADTFSHVAEYDNLLESFNKQASTVEKMKFVEAIADEAIKMGASDAKQLKTAALNFEKDCANFNNADPERINTFVSPMFGMAKDICRGMWQGTKNFFNNPYYNKYMSDAQYTKYSDVLSSERDMTFMEREADAYATRHGYGKELVSGLEKMHRMYTYFGYSKEALMSMIKAGKFRTQMSLFEKLHIISYMPYLAKNKSYSLYPNGADRFKEIMKVSIQGLKANNANPEFIHKYISDIEQIIKSIENYDERSGYRAKQYARYKIILKYLSITSWIDIIVHGRVVPEIEELINQLDNLSNNLISFYGEKFQQLAKG